MSDRIQRFLIAFPLLLLGMAPFSRLSAEGEVLRQELVFDTLYPGDMLELKLELVGDSFSRWKLQAPRHPNLRLLSVQEFPVDVNQDSEYETRWVLLYQAVQPGGGPLAGGYLQRALEEDGERLELESREVFVPIFDGVNDHDAVEPLVVEADRTQSGNGRTIVWLVGIALLLATVALLMRKRGQRESSTVEALGERDQLVREVSAIVSGGALSREDAQRLIAEYRAELSEDALSFLEQVAYSKVGDWAGGLEALRKEIAK